MTVVHKMNWRFPASVSPLTPARVESRRGGCGYLMSANMHNGGISRGGQKDSGKTEMGRSKHQKRSKLTRS